MCVDEKNIIQLKEIMGDDFTLLVNTFITDSSSKIQIMRSTIVSNDANELRMAAHGLKGSALNLSAPKLTELCQELESIGKSGSTEGTEALIDEIELEYKVVTGYLVSI